MTNVGHPRPLCSIESPVSCDPYTLLTSKPRSGQQCFWSSQFHDLLSPIRHIFTFSWCFRPKCLQTVDTLFQPSQPALPPTLFVCSQASTAGVDTCSAARTATRTCTAAPSTTVRMPRPRSRRRTRWSLRRRSRRSKREQHTRGAGPMTVFGWSTKFPFFFLPPVLFLQPYRLTLWALKHTYHSKVVWVILICPVYVIEVCLCSNIRI